MRLIPTEPPTAKTDSGQVIATILTDGTRISVQLTPHEAMSFGHALLRSASEPMTACRPQAEIIAFERKRA